MKKEMLDLKKTISLLLAVCMATMLLVSAAAQTDLEALKGTTLYVYNWGEYISDGSDDSLDVNKEFEARYGIKVVYDTFENNEVMYSKIKGGGVNYDVLIPSDYMIERMIAEDMLQKIDFENVPNSKYIDSKYKGLPYDPNDEYSVPYSVGAIGLIYNTTIVKEAPTSWSALWDAQYSKKILMINNPRDAFAIAHSILGIDYNTTSEADWKAGADKLKEQKAVVQAYVNDEVFNKMESGEAALAPYYAGDFLSMQENNPDLAFVYPSEGVNSFVDAMCIPKNALNKAAAELYINFMQDPEIALANAEYIYYASPNTAVIANADYSLAGDEIIYPDETALSKTQIFENLPQDTLNLMSSLWDEVKLFSGNGAANEESGSGTFGSNAKIIIALGTVAGIGAVYMVFRNVKKKKRNKHIGFV
jgi:spermidine/putrescine transport system substrate-binding protein